MFGTVSAMVEAEAAIEAVVEAEEGDDDLAGLEGGANAALDFMDELNEFAEKAKRVLKILLGFYQIVSTFLRCAALRDFVGQDVDGADTLCVRVDMVAGRAVAAFLQVHHVACLRH